jgi:hypothetical protein
VFPAESLPSFLFTVNNCIAFLKTCAQFGILSVDLGFRLSLDSRAVGQTEDKRWPVAPQPVIDGVEK